MNLPATLDRGESVPGTSLFSSTETEVNPNARSLSASVLPKLTIVIPALNEEESIASTVQRCIDAREHILRHGRIRDMEIVVVSDGSTDRTAEIAQEFANQHAMVSVIVFPKNRGYGAALKEGFRKGTGELVSFLDADGTCDPRYFAEMCRVMEEDGAAVVLGSRMGSGNKMPKIRRLGNRIYAAVLGFLSGRAVSDTASGMRVIRRSVLSDLYPLPDGLHFTPAMSARALLNDLRIVEVPMAYAERVGESKLHVLRDGMRFFAAIFNALLLYRPSRVFNIAALVCLLVGLAWIIYPVEFYLHHRRLEDWMIYRVLLSAFLFSCSFVFLGAGVMSENLLSLVYRRRLQTYSGQLLARIYSPKWLVCIAAASTALGLFLVLPGLAEYLATGHTKLHWSRSIVAVFLVQSGIIGAIIAILQSTINLWKEQLDYVSRNREEAN